MCFFTAVEMCIRDRAEGADAEMTNVPDFTGMTADEARQAAEESGLSVDFIGSGKAKEQSPAAGTEVQRGSRIEAVGTIEQENEETVPNLIGKKLSDCLLYTSRCV